MNRFDDGKGLYRARDGVFAGVCKGFCDRFDLSVFWVRVIAVLATTITGIWPMVVVYIIVALIMKPAPVVPIQTTEDSYFYNAYGSSRQVALRQLNGTFDKLDRRLQRMEDMVTNREFQWERRFQQDI